MNPKKIAKRVAQAHLQKQTSEEAAKPARSLPRGSNRPMGKKFREDLERWLSDDAQNELEAEGVAPAKARALAKQIAYAAAHGMDSDKMFPTSALAVQWILGNHEVSIRGFGDLPRPRVSYPELIAYLGRRFGVNEEKKDAEEMLKGLTDQQVGLMHVAIAGYLESDGDRRGNRDKVVSWIYDSRNLKDIVDIMKWAKGIKQSPKFSF